MDSTLIDNHEWKQLYKKVDLELAKKYNTRPSIIKFIRTNSINKNWTIQKLASRASGLIRTQKGEGGRSYYREVLNFLFSLSRDRWEDITKPNSETIDYMIGS